MNSGMLVSCAKKLDEDVVTLETVSGHSIEALIKLFAEGYTLQPPERSMAMKELSKAFKRSI